MPRKHVPAGKAGPFLGLGAQLGVQAFSLLATVAWFASFHGSRLMASPGKLAVGIKVVRADGSRMGWGRSIGRAFAYYLGFLTLYVGYLIAAFTPTRDGDRLTITLDHAESGNAIDRHMRDGLYEALSLAALDTGITGISLRGAGRTFSLGAELGEFGTTSDPATAHAIRYRTLPARAVLGCADRLEAHVRGACVGAGL